MLDERISTMVEIYSFIFSPGSLKWHIANEVFQKCSEAGLARKRTVGGQGHAASADVDTRAWHAHGCVPHNGKLRQVPMTSARGIETRTRGHHARNVGTVRVSTT